MFYLFSTKSSKATSNVIEQLRHVYQRCLWYVAVFAAGNGRERGREWKNDNSTASTFFPSHQAMSVLTAHTGIDANPTVKPSIEPQDPFANQREGNNGTDPHPTSQTHTLSASP